MSTFTIWNATRGTALAERTIVADGFWTRLRGLLGRRLERGEAMLLVPCRSVHTFGMGYDLDIAFLDKDHQVIALRLAVAPNRVTEYFGHAHAVLELPKHTLEVSGTCVGDQLVIAEVPLA